MSTVRASKTCSRGAALASNVVAGSDRHKPLFACAAQAEWFGWSADAMLDEEEVVFSYGLLFDVGCNISEPTQERAKVHVGQYRRVPRGFVHALLPR